MDYVTSFELLVLLLPPKFLQLIARFVKSVFSQKNVFLNGKRLGCVYSLESEARRDTG